MLIEESSNNSSLPNACIPLCKQDKIDNKYMCPKCRKIMVNVHQADDCGCRYCLECLEEM